MGLLRGIFRWSWLALKGVWRGLRLLGNTAAVLIFAMMLMLLVASHTVSAVAQFATLAIHATTGLQTVTSPMRTASAVSSPGSVAIEREGRSAAARTASDSVPDRASIDRLLAENARLRDAATIADRNATRQISQLTARASLDQAVIERLSERTLALEASEAASRQLASSRAAELSRNAIQQREKRVALNSRIERISSRSLRTANANVAATTGEAIPFWGFAIIVAATAYELKSSCDTMHDIYEMQVIIDPSSAIPEDRDEVCGLQVPTGEEIWEAVKSSPAAAWNSATETAASTSEWAASLEMPDFSLATGWLSGWFD